MPWKHHRHDWTQADDDVIRSRWAAEPTKVLAAEIGVTPNALRARAQKLGLHKDPEDLWKDAEDEVLKLNYRKCSAAKLAAMLPGRTEAAVSNRLIKIGLQKQLQRRWLRSEDEQIRRDYPTVPSARKMAFLMGRSYYALLVRARELGVKRDEEVRKDASRIAKGGKPKRKPALQLLPAAPIRAEAPKPERKATKPKAGRTAANDQPLSAYLKQLPANHQDRKIYEHLTRPGQPRHIMRTVGAFHQVTASLNSNNIR